MVDIVNVALGSRSYDIKIGQGLLAQADEHLAPFIHDKHVIIIAIRKDFIRRILPHGYLGSRAVLIVYQSLQRIK